MVKLSEIQVKEIMARMETLIARKGMKKKDFYAASGISSSLYSQWNTGTVKPSLRLLAQAAEVLGVDVDFLIDGKAKEPAGGELVNGDAELTAYLEELRKRPEMRMLFHTFAGATKEQIEAIVKAWEAMQGK